MIDQDDPLRQTPGVIDIIRLALGMLFYGICGGVLALIIITLFAHSVLGVL